MKRSVLILSCFALMSFALSAKGQEATKTGVAEPGKSVGIECSEAPMPDAKYTPVVTYDPARNAERDINDALAEAKRANKRVLLEVGGLWCIWCRYMDEFFDKQLAVRGVRDQHYVTLKVNFSDENKNEVVLGRYPKIGGFPHIFVLSADGVLLQSQDTEELEEGKGYSVVKFNEFLKKWSASPAGTARK